MLVAISQALDAEQLQAVRARLESAGDAWVDGRVSAGYQGAPVKFNEQIDALKTQLEEARSRAKAAQRLAEDNALRLADLQEMLANGTGKAIAYLDIGWEDLKVAVEYDGEQHRTDRRQYIWDVRRRELLDHLGWIVVRVVVGDRREDIVRRVREAIGRRASHQSDIRRPA
jgi:very-short-patch-repair endonuclease